jgi:hypothetical protein
MRGKLSLILTLTVLIFSGSLFSSEETDLTGIWEGETYVEGGPALMLILSVEHKGEDITGNLSDDMGYIDSEISEAKLEGDVFTFLAVAQSPEGDIVLAFKVTVAGDSMEGAWEAENGAYFGEWTAVREKGN